MAREKMKITTEENEKLLQAIEGIKYTYHIVIKVNEDEEKAYALFEEIQNYYRLYDNSILTITPKDGEDIPDEILIESSDKRSLSLLAEEVKNKYKLKKVFIRKIDKEESIIDSETFSKTFIKRLTVNNKTGGLTA